MKHIDYLIQIPTEDVEPDFRCSHLHSGLGFKGHCLCHAEKEAKSLADALPFGEAEASIETLRNDEVILHL